ncbi:MAG: DUF4189 domain-containing protein [Arenimonas sp.]
MMIKTLFMLIAFAMSNSAIACPEGQQPAGNPTSGNPSGCVPYPGSSQNQSQVPRGRWETRWGAIATDGPSASLGTSISMNTKRKAEKIALTQCRSKGGKACKIDVSYYNQCAVLVTGDTKYLAQSAENIEIATKVGMQKCNLETTNCKIYYADCSPAVWVQ